MGKIFKGGGHGLNQWCELCMKLELKRLQA